MAGRYEEALASNRKARAIYAKIVRDNPDLKPARDRMASLDHEGGRILMLLGRHDEALSLYRQALDAKEEASRAAPDSPWRQRELGYSHFDIGRLHRAAGREAEAISSYSKALSIFEPLAASEALDPYNRACAEAICAALIGDLHPDPGPKVQAQRRGFADRAVANLRKAMDGGHHSPAMIDSDPDFEAIRSRDDFRALLTELRLEAQNQSPPARQRPPVIADTGPHRTPPPASREPAVGSGSLPERQPE